MSGKMVESGVRMSQVSCADMIGRMAQFPSRGNSSALALCRLQKRCMQND